MRTGALYIRVSTDDQVEYSPDAQIKCCLDYAKKNEIIVPEKFIFQDNGISGRKAINRIAFQELIATAKSEEHPIDVILVWKFSRFARNQEEAIVYKNLLKKSKIDVISVSEPIPDGFIGELVERIFEWMDEYYSINLSGEVLRGMSQRASKGQYNSSPPLGYKMLNGTPVIVHEQAEIVKNIFNWYVNDRMSFFDIAKKLNLMGYKTKRGSKFQNRAVAYIIRNPFYIGKLIWNKTDHSTKKLKSPDEWIISNGNFETFISTELFNQAQYIDKTTTKIHRSRPTTTYKHWLSGILVCSSCGNRLVRAYTSKSGTCSFQCTGYNHGSCNVSHMISETKITPAIINGLKTVLDGGDITYTVNRTFRNQHSNETEIIKKKLNRISLKEERIKEAYRDGIDTLDEYKSNKAILNAERNELIEMLSSIPKDENKSKKELLVKIRSAYDVITNSDSTNEQKNNALLSIIEKIVYNKNNNSISIHFFINQ